MDIFDTDWPGYAYFWAQHARQCDNMQRMLIGCSPLDMQELDARVDWHVSCRRLKCELAA